MKKKILAAMLAALAVGAMTLTGCSFGGGDSTEPSSDVENSQVVSETTSSEDTSSEETEDPDNNVIVEPAAFEDVFADNPIDAAYAIESPEALTTLDMTNLEEKYANLWKAEIDHAYQQLFRESGMEYMADDQQKWNNALDSELQLLRDSVTVTGSLARVEYAMKVKNFYREKAKELYGELYTVNPDYTYIYAAY